MKDCVFCKIVAGEVPSTKIFESDDILAFEDVAPVAPTHTLVIPKRHIDSLEKVDNKDTTLLGRLIVVARDIARDKELSESGYRLVINTQAGAGQTVFHVHIHVIGGRSLSWPPG